MYLLLVSKITSILACCPKGLMLLQKWVLVRCFCIPSGRFAKDVIWFWCNCWLPLCCKFLGAWRVGLKWYFGSAAKWMNWCMKSLSGEELWRWTYVAVTALYGSSARLPAEVAAADVTSINKYEMRHVNVMETKSVVLGLWDLGFGLWALDYSSRVWVEGCPKSISNGVICLAN